MQLDLDFFIKDIEGNDHVENGKKIHAGKFFANMLYAAPADEDGLRFSELAKKIYAEGKMDIDTSDLIKLEKFLNTPGKFSIAIYGAIKEAFLKTQADK